MSFVATFNSLPAVELRRHSQNATLSEFETALQHPNLESFAVLISPAADLEKLAALAQKTTLRHFGKVIRLYAPLYLSNECINI